MVKLPSLLIVVYLSFSLNTAVACSCKEPVPSAAALQSADAVFSGRVTDVSSGAYTTYVTFDVEKTWKGINSPIISVSTDALYVGSCGIPFEVGQEWLVYAEGKDKLSAFSCSRTTQLQQAQEDIKVLGVGKIAPPASPLSKLRRSTKIAGVAFVLIGAAAIRIFMRFKKKEPIPESLSVTTE